jgi:hypothetical protein
VSILPPQWIAVTPPILFTLIWVLSVALGKPDCIHKSRRFLARLRRLNAYRSHPGCAVPMLLVWHVYLISRGETSIEGHDNDYFTTKAKERGVVSLIAWYTYGRVTGLTKRRLCRRTSIRTTWVRVGVTWNTTSMSGQVDCEHESTLSAESLSLKANFTQTVLHPLDALPIPSIDNWLAIPSSSGCTESETTECR